MKTRYLLALLTFHSVLNGQAHHGKPDFSAISRELQTHVGTDDVPGLAVAVSRNGEIVWNEGFGWADRENKVRASAATPFYIASVTKTITATALLHLAEQGKLQLDRPVNDYLGPAKVYSPIWDASKATVRRVATHTSGLTTFTQWCDSAGDPRCDVENEIQRYGVLISQPGEVFDYSNLGYGILGHVMARVSGEHFDTYLRDAIFRPLGMKGCAIMRGSSGAERAAAQYDQKSHLRSQSRVSGHEGASGLHCSANDLLSFGRFNLKERSGVNSPLTDLDIDAMHSSQPGTHDEYGLGWWIRNESGTKIVSAQGGTSDSYALLELVPAKDIAIVVIANSYSPLVSGIEQRIMSVLLPGVHTDQKDNPAAPSSPASHDLAGRWSGQILTYEHPIDLTLEILADGQALGQVGNRRSATITNVSLTSRYFYGELRAEPGLPDSPGKPFLIELDLTLHNGNLVGGATFGPLPGEGDGNQFPHFISLARVGR